MSYGDNIRMLRKENGLTLKALGNMLNVSESAIAMYEKGDRLPPYTNIVKLADIFGVSTDFLMDRTEFREQVDLTEETASIVFAYEEADANTKQQVSELLNIHN